VTLSIILAENPLQRDTWQRFDNYSNLCEFLLKELAPKYGGHFPQSGKIYQEFITKDHEITPATPADAEALAGVTGNVYVVIWPAAPAIAGQIILAVGMMAVTTLIKAAIEKEDKATKRIIPEGSPNNQPGQRKNNARVLQRIPDIYGRVKCTPDLIQYPYIEYVSNLQVETIAAIIGVGEYDVQAEDIFEGSTPVQNLPGASLAIYAPFTVPVEDAPQLQIGPAIEDPLLTVIPVREVTGEQLLAPNNTYIFTEDDESEDYNDPNWAALFSYPSAGVGTITFSDNGHQRSKHEGPFYYTERLNVGDKFGLVWRGNSTGLPDAMTARGGVSIAAVVPNLVMGAGGDANIPDLELLPDTPDDDHYVVTAVNVIEDYTGPGIDFAVEYTISVPAAKQAEWEKIALFNPVAGGTPEPFWAPAGTMYNRMAMVYVLNFRLGPFFCNDPNMEQVHFNFVADKGLWIDDGRKQRAYGVKDITSGPSVTGGIEIIIELTPADENGDAIGPTEPFARAMFGSSTRRDFIGETFKITPTFTGRFLVAVRRNTTQYWRTQSFAWFSNNQRVGQVEKNWAETEGQLFDATPVPHAYQFADDIKWTHCYSVSTPKYYPFTDPLTSLGSVTLVHAKTTQVKFAPQREFEKNLNMIVTRSIPFWDGDSFPSTTPTTRGLDAAFDVMRSYYIGNIPDSNIDFESVEQAFSDVFQAFGTSEATEFHHTFDSEQASFEDILTAVGESCFVTFYRQGDMIKASADVSKANASLLFNHRNIAQGSQTFNVSFGTEEDYDGVELEYQDNLDNQLKTYVAPIAIVIPRNPQKIRVAGVRTRIKAAMHAWRAAHILQYQNMVVEFDSCDEAALSIVKDKVLVSNVNDANVQNGDIVDIDGLTVYTSQEVVIGSGDYTLFIQDIDGTVQSIPVVTDSTSHSLVLDGAPSGTLVIDTDAGIYPRYTLVRNAESMPSAFHIKEAQFKNRGVYSVVASNYSEGYYFYDALRLWLVFNEYSGFPPVLKFFDRGPFELDFTEVGTPAAVVDAERQVVYEGPNNATYLLYEDFSGTTLVSYSVSAWVFLDTYSSEICRSSDGPDVFVVRFLNSTDELEILHDGVSVATYLGVELSEWTHVGVTYDDDTEVLRIYINGEEEGIALDVSAFDSFDGLRVFALDGRGDEFRVYNKPKSAEFMRALYQKSIFPSF
jgi:hypothetical protein